MSKQHTEHNQETCVMLLKPSGPETLRHQEDEDDEDELVPEPASDDDCPEAGSASPGQHVRQ